MKLYLVQKSIGDSDITKYLDSARSEQVDIVCFNELALSGCLYEGGDGFKREEVLALLNGYNFDVMVGYPERRGDHLFNSYLFRQESGYYIYDKVNLFEPMNEPSVYERGSEPLVVDTKFGKFGFSICYDLRFDDQFSLLKQKRAEYIFVPAAWPKVRIAAWRELLVKRATDYQFYVIGINAVGDDGTNLFGGTSLVVNPQGKVLAEADQESNIVLKVEL